MSDSPDLSVLVATGIGVSYGPVDVLHGVDLVVGPGDRVGVLGPNGAGKSTLLRVLAGELTPDTGRVNVTPPSGTVGHLPQEPDRRPGEQLREYLARRTGVAAASAALDTASALLADGTTAAYDAYEATLGHWLGLGGEDFDARAAATVADLGLTAGHLEAGTATLSGGQMARAALAAVLLSRVDVLLLDEPTNDLDLAGLAQLEGFVLDRRGGLVVVSHDRAFLDRVVTSVLELDPANRTAREYGGGFTAYREAREIARRHAREDYEEYAGRRQDLVERARMQRAWADKGVRAARRKAAARAGGERDRNATAARVASSEKQAAKARQTDRALERLDVVEEPRKEWVLALTIAAAPRSGTQVAQLRGAVVERDGFRLGPVDLDVAWADRIAITGPNGAGKTTLLAALLGRVPLTAGTARLGTGVVVGGIDQARALLDTDQPLVALIETETGEAPAEVRTLLAKFGLRADHVTRPARSLSPGERTRATLALLQARGVNCLVLDEPTNHLDLPAIEQLESALAAYAGTLLLVTHDRRLLDAVTVTRTLGVSDGQVHEQP